MQIVKRKYIMLFLSALTVLATISKVFIGLDMDENYIVILGARILQGDHLFRECWDLYQTTGITMAIFLAVYRFLTGGYTGVILCGRVVTGVIQLAIGVFTYRMLRKYYKNADLAGLLAANLLPRATLNLEYGFLSVNFFLISMCLLTVEFKEGTETALRRRIGRLAMAAICFCMAVLSYPTMVIVVIPLLVYYGRRIYKNEEATLLKTDVSWFVLFCMIFVGIFFIWIFQYVSPAEMMRNIVEGILCDESHDSNNLLFSFFDSFLLDREKQIQVIAILLSSFAVYVISNFALHRRISFVYYVMCLSSLMLIALNLLKIRECGPYGMQIRYFLMVVIAGGSMLRQKDTELRYLFWWAGIFMFLGTLLGSNLSLAENGAFLYLALLAIVLQQGNAGSEDILSDRISWIAIVIFVISLIFAKGYLVRVDVTKPANIMEYREKIDFGPFKGLYIYPEEKEKYENRWSDFQQNVGEADIPLVLSNDPIYNLFFPNRFTSVTALTTPIYGKQWVEYYANRDYIKPTVIFVDKWTIEGINGFLADMPFGKCIREEMQFDSIIETGSFWILRKSDFSE